MENSTSSEKYVSLIIKKMCPYIDDHSQLKAVGDTENIISAYSKNRLISLLEH